MTSDNYGISTNGGNVTATNLAVGEGATITISGDVRTEVIHEIGAIRSLLKDSDIPSEQQSEISDAVDMIEAEVKAEEPNKSKVVSALSILEKVTKIGGGMLDLGVKLAPHVAAITRFLV
ncbi:hypothetical protein [Ruegeria sp. HKCCD4332]|uniref:hypothetical protein n=1 Tax=Ruegeria sp. HKCCD4332 TaxID=2683021 RepID=UPI001492CE7A|nr:hypothetical protein [Ruegeria sp. HKCCD4332]NOD76377.1 hypothetical protein [Ruegeria sp. HKCCD4332]